MNIPFKISEGDNRYEETCMPTTKYFYQPKNSFVKYKTESILLLLTCIGEYPTYRLKFLVYGTSNTYLIVNSTVVMVYCRSFSSFVYLFAFDIFVLLPLVFL